MSCTCFTANLKLAFVVAPCGKEESNRNLAMIKSGLALSVVLAPFIIGVWCLLYLDVVYAYRLPKSGRKSLLQLICVFAAVGIFVLQVQLMDRLAPGYAHDHFYFFFFVVIQCGGGIVLTFYTGLREKAKVRKMQPHPQKDG